MANTWGSLKWGEGNFGDQPNVTEQVTGVQNNIALNSVDSYPKISTKDLLHSIKLSSFPIR